MEVDSQSLNGNSALCEQQAKCIYNLVGSSDANRITQREFLDPHFQQCLRHIKYLARRHGSFVWAAKDGRDIASYWNTFLLRQCHNRAKVGKALGDGGVDVMERETLTGSGEYGNRAHPGSLCTFHALQIRH